MAEDQKPYQITKEDGTTGKSSRNYFGKGFVSYPNGDTYEGQFDDGIRQGQGKYVYANKDVYEGSFVKNKKHGIGRYKYEVKVNEDTQKKSGGGEYYGHFENGKRHGEGIFTYLNKDTFSGWWQYGKKHGKGTYVYADSSMRLIGIWNQGKMLSGKWVFPNGTVYEGNFKHNKPEGDGIWHFKNGNNLYGAYKQAVNQLEEPDENGKTVDVKLEWSSSGNLFESASLINCLENI